MTPTPDPLREALAALDRILADSESQHPGGWGPDVTTVADLRIARDDIRATLAALAQPAPPLDADLDSYLTLHFRHAHGCGETREFPWDCDCGYRDHLHAIEAALAAQPAPALDVERLMDAEHRWCVEVEGEFALGHSPDNHRRQAAFILARLSGDPA